MFHRRVNPKTQFINQVVEITDRIDALETQPSGNIVIRETLSATNPTNGVVSIIGQLPDGDFGIDPFLYDLEPPPVPTTPTVSVEPGLFIITWDGALQGDIPRDFHSVHVIGHKMNGAATILSVPVGTIRLPTDILRLATDIAAIGETWKFSFESRDVNNNLSAQGPRSELVTMTSYITDTEINTALGNIEQEVSDANQAASAAQSAAASAASDADAAEAAALAATNLAATKAKLLIQPATPATADENANTLWIDTTNNANTPKKWNGSAWIAVTDKVATDAAAAAVLAQNKADTAFNSAATASTAAGNAQTTADGKNRVWYQSTAPAGAAHRQDDIWFNTAADNRISQWNATANTWDIQLVGNAAILANLDAGKITVGTLLASVIGAKSITVDKLVVTSTDNLVVEADFGNNGSSWELNAFKTINATAGRGSLPAMRITGTTTQQTSLNKVNKISVGTEDRFRIGFWAKSNIDLPANVLSLRMRCYTTATAYTEIIAAINEDILGTVNPMFAGVWTNIKGFSPVLPTNTIAVEFFLSATLNATTTIIDVDYIGVTRAADANLVVDGAIDGKTITGATVQTALTGARVVLDASGLKAWDANGINYLTADATGLKQTGIFQTLLGDKTTTLQIGVSAADNTGVGITGWNNAIAGLAFVQAGRAYNLSPRIYTYENGLGIDIRAGGGSSEGKVTVGASGVSVGHSITHIETTNSDIKINVNDQSYIYMGALGMTIQDTGTAGKPAVQLGNDTGWITPTLQNGFAHRTDFGWGGVKYRAYNGYIIYQGSISNASAWGVGTTIVNVPALYNTPVNRIMGTNVYYDAAVDAIQALVGGSAGTTLNFWIMWPLTHF